MTKMTLPMAGMPAVISQSFADVLKAHGFVIARPIASDPALAPLAEQLDERELADVFREAGRNTTQALMVLDEPDEETVYQLAFDKCFILRRTFAELDMPELELLASIIRLEQGGGTANDVIDLCHLAELAGIVEWRELFPEVFPAVDAPKVVVDVADVGYPPGWPRCPHCGDHALDGHISCGRVGCRERNDSPAPPPSGGANEERDGATPTPSFAPSRSVCTPLKPSDALAAGHTLRALAQQKRPNSDTAEVLGRVGDWLVESGR